MTVFTKLVAPQANDRISPIMALHCSGATWRQWRGLQDKVGKETTLLLPQLFGPEIARYDRARTSFSLAVEAEPIVARLCKLDRPAHLVGHSYGGALAIHIARRHPDLVKSLCLYEPTAFNMLKRADRRDMRLASEVDAISAAIQGALVGGRAVFAAQLFTDFWGGQGAWQALESTKKLNMLAWIPKAPLDFSALLNEHHGPAISAGMSVTLMYGQNTNPHTRRIVKLLSTELGSVNQIELAGADHMGPFVFRERVFELVLQHVART
jgi:pimeloyl-ACP methyl ester carboxylesterase